MQSTLIPTSEVCFVFHSLSMVESPKPNTPFETQGNLIGMPEESKLKSRSHISSIQWRRIYATFQKEEKRHSENPRKIENQQDKH